MARTEITTRDIEALAEDVKRKLLAAADQLKQAEGEIVVRIFRRGGSGYDVKLTLTI